MRKDACVVILSHNRAQRNITLRQLLKNYGFKGDWYIMIDDEDPEREEYRSLYPDHLIEFSKDEVKPEIDMMDNFQRKDVVVYARHAIFHKVKALGYKFFLMLDDDYEDLGTRCFEGFSRLVEPDKVFDLFFDYLEQTPSIQCVCFAQGGDCMGGISDGKLCLRKAMNTFFCDVDRPLNFVGTLNEDANLVADSGTKGVVFITNKLGQIKQSETQEAKGGLTEAYLSLGTYVKSFYSLMVNPSAVRIGAMGVSRMRIHHKVNWKYCVPKILNPKYKKS